MICLKSIELFWCVYTLTSLFEQDFSKNNIMVRKTVGTRQNEDKWIQIEAVYVGSDDTLPALGHVSLMQLQAD